jgi:hypothetical protein
VSQIKNIKSDEQRQHTLNYIKAYERAFRQKFLEVPPALVRLLVAVALSDTE